MKKKKETNRWSNLLIWFGGASLLVIGMYVFHNHEFMTWYIKIGAVIAYVYCMVHVGGEVYRIQYDWRVKHPRAWEERIMRRVSKQIKEASRKIALARQYQEENYKQSDAYKKRFDPFNMDLSKIMEKGKQDGNVF